MILTGGGMHEKAMHHVIGTVPVAPIIRLREVAEQVVAAYLESLTAGGPVILLPTDDGVKVAGLVDVVAEYTYGEDGVPDEEDPDWGWHLDIYDRILDAAAREVAE